ncbi:MAG: membrane dipeptidase [Bacilli bacterium]|nr:membrane dipeptidase [Bacilli bacterium]
MYDMHYDLLTILYYNYKLNNKYSNIHKLINDCKNIYNNNIIGGIINLFFMSPNEMYDEIGITLEELLDLEGMFKKSVGYLNYLKDIGVISKKIDFIYSIEGCDYLEDVNELDNLYKMGLRSVLPVWNNKNRYASGIRSDSGITEEGIKLIEKAVSLGIIIDISHANKRSFFDILNILSNYSKDDYTLIASHSNVRSICDRERNLDDYQLFELKNMDGYIGLFTNSNFLSLNNKNMSYKERQLTYLKHLDYVIEKIGFSRDRIIVSTDDMNFHPDDIYHQKETFPIENVSKDLYTLISEKYDEDLARMIMYSNPKKIISKVKKR